MDTASTNQTQAERFGELLYRLRETRGLSQNAAAKQLKISQPRLRDYELGCDRRSGRPTVPPPETIRAIARFYRYPADRLLLLAGVLPTQPADPEEADLVAAFLALTLDEKRRVLGRHGDAEADESQDASEGHLEPPRGAQ